MESQLKTNSFYLPRHSKCHLIKNFNDSRQFYIYDTKWQDSNHIMIVWGNRLQNEYIMELCTVPSGVCQFVSVNISIVLESS